MQIPALRLVNANPAAENPAGQYVLYWMIANRRLTWNYALDHALNRARHFGKPLLIFEPLAARYRWASERLHRFVIEGMRDHSFQVGAGGGEPGQATAANRPALTFATNRGVAYYPYVEPAPGEATPLLYELAQNACVVITDDFPCFFLPQMVAAASRKLRVRLQQVDSNGVVPLRLADRTFTMAHSFRRWLQKNMLDLLLERPRANPLRRQKLPSWIGIDDRILSRWPPADFRSLLECDGLSLLPINHDVKPVAGVVGGAVAAQQRLQRFLDEDLARYARDRNHPDAHATSGLSPYLHFGHISAQEVVSRILDKEAWTPDKASPPNGKNVGFWNTRETSEAFLDQVLTWRELGFNFCHRRPRDYDRYQSLPNWAVETLAAHADDPRPALYSLEQFEQAQTHDRLWNAAQRELVSTGRMHNYLRMLWGKKILHWSESPQQALRILLELNNKYALDGRDPNAYSGIFWILGRYDRAWGPVRPVFGTVRYMTSDSAQRKLKLKRYLATYGDP